MLDFQRVSFWLDTLPDILHDTPPSPCPHDSPRSHLKVLHTKRKGDPNRTLRPTHGDAISSAASSTASSLAPSENSDAPSRSSSLKKQMMSLRLDDEGLEFRQLKIDTAPPAAADLLAVIREIGNGLDVLPRTHKATILESTWVKDQTMRIWRYAFKEDDAPDVLPGYIPAPDEMALVCELACQCHDKSHEVAAWNMEVHHRLLQAVFRQPGSSKGGPLNSTNCTTARPHDKYLPYSSPANMVDFCLYLDDLSDTNALQALGRQTPTLTVDHTNFAPLQPSPIALSIETKRPGKELDAARLQMGVWHSAQWKFLRSIVGLTGQPMSAAEEVSRRRLADEALAELGFIPGVIVQGHRWLFVCSTLEDRKTVLWTERQFGTTQSILDSYQIVAGLRELAGWIRDVYLPRFQSKVLSGLSDENET